MKHSRALFLQEARESLALLERGLAPAAGEPDADAMYRAARLIRGGAQLGRYRRVMQLARTLEDAFRALREGRIAWDAGLQDRATGRVAELTAAVAAVEAGEVEPDMEMDMEGDEMAGNVVAMEELEYGGREALERAMELREALEDAIVTEEPAGPILDELFDLIRLGMR